MGSGDTCESLCSFACSTCGSQSVRTGCAVLGSTLGDMPASANGACLCVCLSDCRWHPSVCVCWTRPKAGSCAASGHQQVCVCVSVRARVGAAHGSLSSTWIKGKQASVGRKQLRTQVFGRCTDQKRVHDIEEFVAVLSAVACRWQHQPRSRPWQPPSGCLWCTCDSAGCQLLLRGCSGDSYSRAAAAGVVTQHIQAAR